MEALLKGFGVTTPASDNAAGAVAMLLLFERSGWKLQGLPQEEKLPQLVRNLMDIYGKVTVPPTWETENNSIVVPPVW